MEINGREIDTESLQTPEAVWDVLSRLDKGPDRAALLRDERIRGLILNSGAFVIFSAGQEAEGATLKEKLAPIRVLQTHRLRTVSGQVILDGNGTFGGLSERSRVSENLAKKIEIPLKDLLKRSVDEFIDQTIKPKLLALVTLRDDLALDQGKITLVENIDQIGRATVAREMKEEAGELGLDVNDFAAQVGIITEQMRTIFNAAALTSVPLQSVKDDNFLINIWNGSLDNPAYAVTPLGYLRSLGEDIFNRLVEGGRPAFERNKALFQADRQGLKGQEMLGIEAVPVFTALGQWGKMKDGNKDLSSDYRYPHEWLSVWYRAQTALTAGGMDKTKAADTMIALAREAQQAVIDAAERAGETPYNVNFAGALAQMNGGLVQSLDDLYKFDRDFGLPEGTFITMHKAAEDLVAARGFAPAHPLARYLPQSKPATPKP